MLEYQPHQAAGLQRLGATQGPHLVAVVAHGDSVGDLPLLWRLCSAYLELGYGVTVLDATRQESAAEPGLARLLEDGFLPGSQHKPEAAWQILPASRGLYRLHAAGQGARAWRPLSHLFADDTVLVLYAPPQTLAACLHGSGSRPLLAVSAARNALLTSYQALKRLLMDGGLEPTLVDTTGLMHGTPPIASQAMASLAECARNFLGYQIRQHLLGRQLGHGQQDYDLKPLASRLLEFGLDLGDQSQFSEPLATDARATKVFAGTH